LAEVAKAAVELDGVTQMVLTTGTPNTPDRGAAILYDSVVAIKAKVIYRFKCSVNHLMIFLGFEN
jgi:biotin synthase-related radical SAM superfamily protein